MNLKFIKETQCPICGCNEVVKEEVEISVFSKREINRHCNGGLWEKRTFLCGQRLEYIPNFSSTEVSKCSVCQNNEVYILKNQRRNKAKESVLEYINSLTDVDPEYKEDLKTGRFIFN